MGKSRGLKLLVASAVLGLVLATACNVSEVQNAHWRELPDRPDGAECWLLEVGGGYISLSCAEPDKESGR